MAARYVLVDISNTFTKVAVADGKRIARVMKLPTRDVTAVAVRRLLRGVRADHAVVASVVPERDAVWESALPGPVCWVRARRRGVLWGVVIDYPRPRSIGADRIANAVATVELFPLPAIVVDFGTAVTFDVLAAGGRYTGGVIAPGLGAMTEYLHSRTALLPRITLREPTRAVGTSTRGAMLAGAVFGYRGLVGGILAAVTREAFPDCMPTVIATGGDAELIGASTGLFDAVDPHLTLKGLHLIACRRFAVP